MCYIYQADSHNDNQFMWLPVHRNAFAPLKNNLTKVLQIRLKSVWAIFTLCRAGDRNLRTSAASAGQQCCRFSAVGDIDLANGTRSATLIKCHGYKITQFQDNGLN